MNDQVNVETFKNKLRTIKNIDSGIKFNKIVGHTQHLCYCPNKINSYNIILIKLDELDPQDQIVEYRQPYLMYIHGIGSQVFDSEFSLNYKYISEQFKISIEESSTICEFVSHILDMTHTPQEEFNFNEHYAELATKNNDEI